MKREFRLTRSTDFKRVRRVGKSYAHPLIVLIVAPGLEGSIRIGVAASKSVGNAVKRNRAKRRIRAAIQPLLREISSGWDIVILARPPLLSAGTCQTAAALRKMLAIANLVPSIPSSEHMQNNG